jgi:hypothetical protein
MTPDQRLAFSMKEYEESAKAFIACVQVAQNLFQSFLFGNGVLAALLGGTAGFSFGATSKYFLSIIPIVGILSAAIFIFMISRIRSAYDICRIRCVEIEAELGGKLFTMVGTARGTSTSVIAVRLLGSTFMFFWGSVLLLIIFTR